MSKKRREAEAAIRRRLIDDKDSSPFEGIRLVEKKEETKKKAVKPVPKKPSEIVQGYNPSSSFADILYSFEHTGNPYSMPKPKASQSAKATDFGDILERWENKGKPKKKAQPDVPQKKSVYKATKSFGDILSAYEGSAPKKEKNERAKEPISSEVPSRKAAAEIDIPISDAGFFREKEADDVISSEVSWTVFGGKNESFVRPSAEAEPDDGHLVKKASPKAQYKPEASFADILSEYEAKKKRVAAPQHRKQDNADSGASFFKSDGNRAEGVAWSVYGGNAKAERKEGFAETLAAFEKENHETFEDYIKEKGDDAVKKETLTISKLRTMPPQATLDLHGLTVDEADKAVRDFLAECQTHGLRKISIITGKGLHSEDGVGVLRQYATAILDNSGIVSEKANAPISAGGAGAIWIILKS